MRHSWRETHEQMIPLLSRFLDPQTQNSGQLKQCYFMQSASHNSKKGPSLLPSDLNELTDEILTSYIGKFMLIKHYQSISQGRQLLVLLAQCTDEDMAGKVIKKMCTFHKHAPPEGKTCMMQFYKDSMEIGKIGIYRQIQKYFVPLFYQICQYRSSVKSIQRGSTYFMGDQSKNADLDKFSELIRLSNTYFRMAHEFLYVWGVKYFPGSIFSRVYEELSISCTFPEFPSQFKFFSQERVRAGIQKLRLLSLRVIAPHKAQKQDTHLDKFQNPKQNTHSEMKTQKVNQDLYSKIKTQRPIQNMQSEKKAQKPKQSMQKDANTQLSTKSSKPRQAQPVSQKKIKPQKKGKKSMETLLPRKIVCRQSSIDQPEDLTAQIDEIAQQPLLESPLEEEQEKSNDKLVSPTLQKQIENMQGKDKSVDDGRERQKVQPSIQIKRDAQPQNYNINIQSYIQNTNGKSLYHNNTIQGQQQPSASRQSEIQSHEQPNNHKAVKQLIIDSSQTINHFSGCEDRDDGRSSLQNCGHRLVDRYRNSKMMRRFQQISMTIVPETKAVEKAPEQTEHRLIKEFEEKIYVEFGQLSKQLSKNKEELSQIAKILEEEKHSRLQSREKVEASVGPDKQNSFEAIRNLVYSSRASHDKSMPQQTPKLVYLDSQGQQPTKKSVNKTSSQSKRGSIRKQAARRKISYISETDQYSDGTMLHLLAKRKNSALI